MDNKAILGTMQEVTKEKCPFLLKFSNSDEVVSFATGFFLCTDGVFCQML